MVLIVTISKFVMLIFNLVLQRLQDLHAQAPKVEEKAVARLDDADAAHDRDFASLKSIVGEALSDAEQLQRLWRSIDVTSNALCCNDYHCCPLTQPCFCDGWHQQLANAPYCRQRLYHQVCGEHVAYSSFSPHTNVCSQASPHPLSPSHAIVPRT